MRPVISTTPALAAVREFGQPLRGIGQDYDGLLAQVGSRRVVVLGESTHGSHEFYQIRAQISRRLIEEKGFEAIAVAADACDCNGLNRFVEGLGKPTLAQALGGQRGGPGSQPLWLWRNTIMLGFLDWLRQHNRVRGNGVGFYGLDPQNFDQSVATALMFLSRHYPGEVCRARHLCDGLAPFGQRCGFGQAPPGPLSLPAKDALIAALVRNHERHQPTLERTALTRLGGSFQAERYRQTASRAPLYYQKLFASPRQFWNLRERQMSESVLALQQHLRAQGGRGKVVVWTHSLNAGDASATQGGWHGQRQSLGQLLRARAGAEDCLLTGLTTHSGHVTLAAGWGGAARARTLLPAAETSLESLFWQAGLGRFYLPLTGPGAAPLATVMLQRALGLQQDGSAGQTGEYFHSAVARQFDALIHLDKTTALRPVSALP